MVEAEHWPGDCGDLIDALWYLNIDRAIQQAIDLTLGTLSAYGLPDMREAFAELFPSPYPYYHELFKDWQ